MSAFNQPSKMSKFDNNVLKSNIGTLSTPSLYSKGWADVTATILFNLRGEKLRAPWFLTTGFNLIWKTLIDNLYQKTAEKTHKQWEYGVGS